MSDSKFISGCSNPSEITDPPVQKVLEGLNNLMGKGSQFDSELTSNSDLSNPLRLLIVEKARLKRASGDHSLAKALDIIVAQYDLGFIDLTWDAWKGTVVVIAKEKN